MYEKYNHELSKHTVKSVKYKVTRGRYPRLHGKNAVKSYHGYGQQIELVLIETDSGFLGWGPYGRYYGKPESEDVLKGKKVSELIKAESGITDEKYGLYDIALHDLAGRILGVPVSKMVNPDAVCCVPMYDGAVYMNDIIPEDKPFGADKVLEECAYDYELGHRTFKIKVGRGHKWMEAKEGLKRDIEIVRRIRKDFPDTVLMIDGNDGFTPGTLIELLKGVEPCPMYWIEEPFREDEANNRVLRDYLDIHMPGTLIADGESRPDINQLFDLSAKGLMDVWQPDIVGYGFTPWRALMKELAAKGFRASPHAWGDVIKTHYCAHLAAAYPMHTPYVEGILGDTEGIDHSGYTLKNGILTVPEQSGFGMDFVWTRDLEY